MAMQSDPAASPWILWQRDQSLRLPEQHKDQNGIESAADEHSPAIDVASDHHKPARGGQGYETCIANR